METQQQQTTRSVLKDLVKIIISVVLFLLLLFFGFGFLASFEPYPYAMLSRIMYGILMLGSALLMIRLSVNKIHRFISYGAIAIFIGMLIAIMARSYFRSG